MNDIKITTLKVRKLTAKWAVDLDSWSGWNKPKRPVSEMTEEEREDEAIRRLREPPKPKHTLDELSEILSMEISKEIEREILEAFRLASGTHDRR